MPDGVAQFPNPTLTLILTLGTSSGSVQTGTLYFQFERCNQSATEFGIDIAQELNANHTSLPHGTLL